MIRMYIHFVIISHMFVLCIGTTYADEVDCAIDSHCTCDTEDACCSIVTNGERIITDPIEVQVACEGLGCSNPNCKGIGTTTYIDVYCKTFCTHCANVSEPCHCKVLVGNRVYSDQVEGCNLPINPGNPHNCYPCDPVKLPDRPLCKYCDNLSVVQDLCDLFIWNP